MSEAPVVKRKPGRPRKYPIAPEQQEAVALENGNLLNGVKDEPKDVIAQPKKRGRPRKHPPSDAAAADPPAKRPRGRPPGSGKHQKNIKVLENGHQANGVAVDVKEAIVANGVPAQPAAGVSAAAAALAAVDMKPRNRRKKGTPTKAE